MIGPDVKARKRELRHNTDRPAVVLLSLEFLFAVTHTQQMSLINIQCHYLLKQLIQCLNHTNQK